jgi:hypothetical protein
VDWISWLQGIALVALNNLVLLIWKPWAGAYAGEKGKNLARKEDLDKILDEVRAVTATQKAIEGKMSLDVYGETSDDGMNAGMHTVGFSIG